MNYKGYPIEQDGKRFTIWIGELPMIDCPDEPKAKKEVDRLIAKEQKNRVRFSF